jgi:hypothetical protein
MTHLHLTRPTGAVHLGLGQVNERNELDGDSDRNPGNGQDDLSAEALAEVEARANGGGLHWSLR